MSKIAARILVVDDDRDVVNAARVVLRQRFENVETENNPQRISSLLESGRYDVILLDMNFSAGRSSGNEGLFWLQEIFKINPDQQVLMITAYGDIKLAVEAMKLGAADFIVKPWENEKLEATVLAAVKHSRDKRELHTLKTRQSHLSRIGSAPENEIIGNSTAIQDVLKMVDKVAVTDANVLILGENGTGKELIAKLLHQKSKRKDLPFVKVDIGALSTTLFESELFGHKKGAFTDAREDRIGKIELASGGTLFIDEIGNLTLSLQSKLLSVLQNRVVVPIGSNVQIPLDIRLITATNLDLHDAVTNGIFREDLIYRINTVEIALPPLRNRPEDIPILASHFLSVYASKYRKEKKSIGAEAINHLQRYSWPGNVRELQHAMERAVIMSENQTLGKNDFLLTGRKGSEKKIVTNLEDMERDAIVSAIEKYKGNMSKVAKELGLGRTTLYRKMTKYGLEK
jgi:two-component system, NtrC family, response regulator HydG